MVVNFNLLNHFELNIRNYHLLTFKKLTNIFFRYFSSLNFA